MTRAAGRPAKVETVLLDAGGVLLDLDFAYLARLLHARGGELVPIEDLARAEASARTEVDRRVREGGRAADAWRDYFRIVLHQVGAPLELRESVIDALHEAHERVGIWTAPIPGAVEAVQCLKRDGYRVGVVSNAEGRVERDLATAGFGSLFETVVDSHLVGVEKPDPAIFRLALARLGGREETTVFLGDVPAIDVAGARAAGIAPLLLDRFELYPDAGVPTLRSIAELPNWLAGDPSS